MIFLARTHAERDGCRTRQEILNIAAHSPGLTKTQICRKMGLALGTISHHIRILEAEQKISRRKIHGWTRLYIPSTPSIEMWLMPLLRENIVHHLLAEIEKRPGLGIQDLSKTLGLSRKIVRRQLGALVGTGAVTRTESYRPKFFVRPEISLGLGEVPGQPDFAVLAGLSSSDKL